MADDYANTPCSSLTSWANGNGMSGADAIFSDSEVSMSDYGTPGMPKIIVVGCSGHAVYYNANYTAAGIGDAIDEALLDCATTSIADNKFENSSFKLKLSPNPAGNNVTVSYEMNESSVVVLDIVNMTGRTVVAISNSFQNTGHNEVRVNTTSLIDGFYFLRIQSGKETQVVKFSVSH